MARLGLSWISALSLIGAGLYVGAYVGLLGFELTWTYQSPESPAHVALPTLLALVGGSALLFLLRQRCSLEQARLAAAAHAIVVGSVIFYDGALDGEMTTDVAALLYLLVAIAVPFRPLQVLGLGGGLMTAAAVVGWVQPFDLAGAQVGFMATATAAATGIAAVLYRRHRVRVDTELALHQSRQILHETASVAQVGGFSAEDATGEVYWTPQVYEIFEADPSVQPTVEKGLQYYAPTVREQVREAVLACFDGEPYDLEVPIITEKGHSRWVRTQGRPSQTGGDPDRIYGAIQDITTRKRAQQNLAEREELLRTITENVSEGIYRSTPEDGVVYANEAFAQMYGYESPEAICQADSLELYADPEEREQLTDTLRRKGGLQGREVRYRRRDGSVFIGRLTCSVQRGEDGEVAYYDGVVADITERKRREQALKEERDLLNQLIETSPAAVALLDDEGTFVRVNRRVETVFGVPETTIVGRPYDDASWGITDHEGNEIPDEELPFSRVKATGEPIEGAELAVEGPDGERRLLSMNGAPFRGADGTFEGAVFHISDVTERKRREQQLRQAKQEAETQRQEAERQRQEAEEQRQEAEKQRRRAEEASQSKSRFLAGVAHDLKSPVTAIAGFAEVLSRRLQDENRELIGSIRRSVREIDEMADSLREISQLESGTITLALTSVPLPDLLRDVVETKSARAERAGMNLQVEADGSPEGDGTSERERRCVKANEQALRRAVTNLVDNALAYSEAGDTVTLRVESDPDAAIKPEGRPTVAIVVADTGPGIDPEFMDDLFEPFTRNAPDTDGTGLGLAVTKELTEAMGGTITVESEPGTGTQFSIVLPAATDSGDSQPE